MRLVAAENNIKNIKELEKIQKEYLLGIQKARVALEKALKNPIYVLTAKITSSSKPRSRK